MITVIDKKYPLSKEETSLYIACTMNKDWKNAYVVGWSAEFPAQPSEMPQIRQRLEAVTAALFDRHRILSAKILQDENGILCKYDSGESPVIEYETLDGAALSDESYCTGIDIAGGRLCRVIIVQLPGMLKYYMIIHHILIDGTGIQNLMRDFEVACRGDDIGGPDTVPYEFALREQEAEKGEAFKADRAYFTALLSDAQGQAPAPDAHGSAASFALYTRWFDRVDPKAVRQKKQASGVRTSTIFTAAVGYALSLFNGAKQAVLATAMTGRTPETQNSCGMFVRTLPMICSIAPNRNVDDYLRDLDQQTTKAREHNLYTYMDMNTECGLTMPVCFAYQGDMDDNELLFDGAVHRSSILHSPDSDYEINFFLFRKDGRYRFEAAYRSDHYTAAFMESMALTVEQVLNELLSKQSMAEVQPTSDEQLKAMDAFNQTERDFPVTDRSLFYRFSR